MVGVVIKKLFFFLIFSGLALGLKSSPFRWDLQITDPQFELTNTLLKEERYQPYLQKTSWRCWVHPTEKKSLSSGILEIKKLSCSYSVKKTGKVSTFVSCSSERPYNEGLLELYDERKKLTFKVMLTCRLQTPS